MHLSASGSVCAQSHPSPPAPLTGLSAISWQPGFSQLVGMWLDRTASRDTSMPLTVVYQT
jgi:hypothetical protein